MMRLRLLATSLFFLLQTSHSVFSYQKELEYIDRSYEASIKTVQLYPEGNSVQATLAPSVVELDDPRRLILEFDDLRSDADYYFVRFIHCNADWAPSDLRPNMYLDNFNEFEIEEFDFSSETRINYVHYRFPLPRMTKTGNYLLVVYRDRRKKDLILSKRFMVYQNQASVGARVTRSSSVDDRDTHQRLEVTLSYGNLQSMDPRRDFKVVIRQNQRWDNLKTEMNATFVDDNSKVLQYRNLGPENDFPGGNEFRFFDLSTINFTGRNVAETRLTQKEAIANLGIDRVRADGYLQNLDLNGKFYIRDQDANSAGRFTAEYATTNFRLEYPQPGKQIYLLGSFNNWTLNDASKLQYDEESKQYRITTQLKQGWYDYIYFIDDPSDPFQLEKSFFETENLYEIFVYFRPMGARGDELVAYSRVDFNVRR